MAQPIIAIFKIFLLVAASAIVSISCYDHTDELSLLHKIGYYEYRPQAESLYRAIINNDKKRIIEIFIERNRDTRFSLVDAYRYKFGRSLTDDFRKKVTGDFGILMSLIARSPLTFDAIELHDTLHGFYGLDYFAFTEIAAFHNMTKVEAEYQRFYGVKLIQDFEKLPSWVQQRIEKLYDPSLGFEKSQNQYYADLLPLVINNRRHFTRLIVLSLNDRILNQVRKSYEKSYHEPIESLLNRCPDEDYREAVLAIFNFKKITRACGNTE